MIALALSALLSFQDPAGDTFGNGTLAAPTATVFRNLSSFDLLGVEVLDTVNPATLELRFTFAALPNPLGLPNGFSLPITELYIEDEQDENEGETVGNPDLLPGSGMKLPDGASWHYAFRLSGDRVQAFVAEDGAVTELSAADGLELSVEDNVITLKTPLPRPEAPTLYGVVGAYSPFSASGWQSLSAVPAPWAFSSSQQTVPVVDVLAEDAGAQVRAVDSQILPALRRATPPAAPQENRWLLLVAGGVVVALVGVVGRFTVPKATSRAGLPPEHEAASKPESGLPPGEPDEAATTPAEDAATEGSLAEAAGPNVAGPEVSRSESEVSASRVAGSKADGSGRTAGLQAAPTRLDVEESGERNPATGDPETAEGAWVSSEVEQPEKPLEEPVPELPETYPPGTDPAHKNATPLELNRADWLEHKNDAPEDDTGLWKPTPADPGTTPTRADTNRNDTDLKHL